MNLKKKSQNKPIEFYKQFNFHLFTFQTKLNEILLPKFAKTLV